MPDLQAHATADAPGRPDNRPDHDTAPSPAAGTWLSDRIVHHARTQPDAAAIVEERRTTDYGTLDRRVDEVARYVRPWIGAPEGLVAVCLPRGADAAVAVLSVMRAGGAAVLLNPADPPARLAAQLAVGHPAAVITTEAIATTLPATGHVVIALDRDDIGSAPVVGPAWPVRPESLAYVVYTSGSTGEPKAVGGCHGTVANLAAWSTSAYGLGPADRSTWVGLPSFGAVPAEVWSFLAAGAAIHVPPDEVVGSPAALRDWMVEHRITVSYLVRTIADRLCDLTWPAYTALRLMISTGEKFLRWTPPELPFDFAMTYGSSEMLNITGAVDQGRGRHLTSRDLSATERSQRAPSTGWPMANRDVLLLDEDLREVPAGTTGEIYIGGRHLFRGYLGRPGATAERLIPHPTGQPGERLFGSGDIGRWAADGTLEVSGRVDDQVKIRGHRVEPGELELVLRSHPGVTEAVAKAVPNASGDLQLVAWIVPAATTGPKRSGAQLRDWLAERLPAALVPTAVVRLETLPQNANGKVDRSALPVPELSRAELGVEFVAPRNASEAAVAGICAQLLGIDRLSVLDRLTDLGADSLLLMRLDTALQQTFGTDIGVRQLTAEPTVAAIATHIGVGVGGAALPTVRTDPDARHEPFRLTETQQAYWIGRSDGVDLGGVGCHGYFEWDRPDLDPDRFTAAWRALIDRHDMLRAVVLPDGRQQVQAQVEPYQVEVVDLRDEPAGVAEGRLAEIRASMENEVFDPLVWPMYQVRLTQLHGGRTRIHLSFDLIIADAWSYFSILVPELHDLYADPTAAGPPLTLTFRDYLGAEQRLAETPRSRRAERYWRERLNDLPPAPQLPMAPTSPATGQPPRFQRWSGGLDADAWRRLRDRAAAVGVTPAGVLISAFADVLRTWTGQDRFALNIPLLNRFPLHPEVDQIVGDFTSTSLLAVDDWPGTFGDRAAALQRQLNDDLDHRFFTGTSVLRELNQRRGGGNAAAMPIVVTPLLGTPRAPDTAFGEPVYGVSQTPQVLLDYQIYETGQELRFTWDARADLIADGLLDDMFAAHQRLLDALAGPDDRAWADGGAWVDGAPGLVPAEQLRRRDQVNDTDGDLPDCLLPELVEAHAAADPRRPAIVDSRRIVDYGELDRHGRLLAEELIDLGVRPGALVAVVMEKGWEQAVAVLAVVRTGAAYLPVDPELPPDRIRLMLQAARVAVALTTPGVDAAVSRLDVKRLPVTPPAAGRRPGRTEWPVGHLDDLAYLLYTSGSTGVPKGAMVAHRGVMNTVLDVNRRFGIDHRDRALGVSALSFDLSAYDLFGLLAAGGTLVLPDPAGRREPAHWTQLCRDHRVTVWNSVPALAQMLVEHVAGEPADSVPLSLRRVLLSGDKVPFQLPGRIRAVAPTAEVITLGGPTETSIWSIWHRVDARDSAGPLIPYGRPLRNCRHYILDHHQRPSPDLVPGEIYVGGAGVGLGYWDDPTRTAERFVTHPITGERVFRSGDLGYFRRDGEIEILGRTDQQVKINGHRVELGEIEAALAEHCQVRAAAAVALDTAGGGRQLAAFVERADVQQADPIDPAELVELLRARVPDYVVPKVVRVLDALPLSPNGKVDRLALSRLAAPAPDEVGSDPAPTTVDDIGAAVLTAFRTVLNRPAAGYTDNFFDLGGDSVRAVGLVTAIRAALGMSLGVGTVFRAPTAAGLAEIVRTTATEPSGEPALQARSDPGPGPFVLSFGQRRLWFLEQLAGDVPAYNFSSTMRLVGPLDIAALRAGIDSVVARHDVLRSRFEVRDGRPVRVVDELAPAALDVVDLRDRPPAERAREADQLAHAQAATRFDLERGPLFQFVLIRLGNEEQLLVQTLHHLVFDGRSLDLLRDELGECYRAAQLGQEPELPALALRYDDFATWQQQRLADGWLDRHRDYWLEKLAGSPPMLELATRRRPARESHRGTTVTGQLDPALSAQLGQAAQAAATTEYALLLTAFAVLLRRYAGQDDLLIGTPMSDRVDDSLRDLMGFLVNTVVLRLDLGGDPRIDDLLRRAARTVAEAHEHRDYPLELLIDALGVERGPSHNPLFQVMFSLEDGELAPVELASLRVEAPVVVNDTAKFDLTLTATRAGDGLWLRWEYATDVLDADTIDRIAADFPAVLAGLIADPTRRLSAVAAGLAPTVPATTATAATPTAPSPADRSTLATRFAAQAAATPDRIAVGDGERRLTYRELEERADRLSRALAGRGIGPEDLVGVYLDRTVDLISTMVGVTGSGAAYLPLDIEHPAERIALILRDAAPAAVLATGATADRLRAIDAALPIHDPDELIASTAPAPPTPATPGSLAYVIYTSGSTGVPKGVAITQHNALRLFTAAAGLGLGPDDVWSLTHSIAFDFSVWEMWGALLHGGRLVIVPRPVARVPEQLRELIERERVTILSQTPTAFAGYAAADAQHPADAAASALRLVVLGGEAVELPPLAGWLTRYRDSNRELINMYGITETTVHVTLRRLAVADLAGELRSPIGPALPDLTGHVLDRDLVPVPIGATGEVVVGGAGVARGYLGRPGLTADRFRPDPWSPTPGARMYRSGDLVRQLGTDLDYVGRADRQLKIRGFRIEPAEVETALLAHPRIQEAAVAGRPGPSGRTELVAYVVAVGDVPLPAEEIQAFLGDRLPTYLVPAITTRLDRLPRNVNGKVDVDALPAPSRTRGGLRAEFVAPASRLEEMIAQAWAGVLGVDRVGVLDNFFSLGGDSMRTVEIVSRLAVDGVRLSVADIYRNPTPHALALALAAVPAAVGGGPAPASPAPTTRPFALLAAADRNKLRRRSDRPEGTH